MNQNAKIFKQEFAFDNKRVFEIASPASWSLFWWKLTENIAWISNISMGEIIHQCHKFNCDLAAFSA